MVSKTWLCRANFTILLTRLHKMSVAEQQTFCFSASCWPQVQQAAYTGFGSASPQYHTRIPEYFNAQCVNCSLMHSSPALTSPLRQTFSFCLTCSLSWFLATQCYGGGSSLLHRSCPQKQLFNLTFTSPTSSLLQRYLKPFLPLDPRLFIHLCLVHSFKSCRLLSDNF